MTPFRLVPPQRLGEGGFADLDARVRRPRSFAFCSEFLPGKITPRMRLGFVYTSRLTIVAAALMLAPLPTPFAAEGSGQVPSAAQMSYLDNGVVKVGVDLNHGGAIVFLARAGGGNLINNFDLGRQVQLSFFSGPVPFDANGQRPQKHWEHIGWNPIQAGDEFKNPSFVLAHENDGHTLHVTCRPLQWPLNNVPGDCTFDSWLELDGPVVKARARLKTPALTASNMLPAFRNCLPCMPMQPFIVSSVTQAAVLSLGVLWGRCPRPRANIPGRSGTARRTGPRCSTPTIRGSVSSRLGACSSLVASPVNLV
ncbi:MAG: hypothetical protein FJ387_06880 [Verrucomicrobia bacterium]|nr:hypothetical protein [Verrucomicrobiota bacterium]